MLRLDIDSLIPRECFGRSSPRQQAISVKHLGGGVSHAIVTMLPSTVRLVAKMTDRQTCDRTIKVQ